MPCLLEFIHDKVLVFREYLGKPICFLYKLDYLSLVLFHPAFRKRHIGQVVTHIFCNVFRENFYFLFSCFWIKAFVHRLCNYFGKDDVFPVISATQIACIQDVCAQPKDFSDVLCNCNVVTGKHLNADVIVLCILNCFFRVLPWWVKQRNKSYILIVIVSFFNTHSQCPVAIFSKLVYMIHYLFRFYGVDAKFKNYLRSTFSYGKLFPVWPFNERFRPFAYRIKRFEL